MELGPRTQDALHAALGKPAARAIWEAPGDLWDDDRDFPIHFGFDAEPITLRVWATIFECSPARILAQEWIVPGYEQLPDRWRHRSPLWLSTVWLGLDHNFASPLRGYPGPEEVVVDTRPWIFESMLFPSAPVRPRDVRLYTDSGEAQGQWRYATFAEAGIAHGYIASELRSSGEPPSTL